MNQVTEFFSGIFSSREWPARWHCGYWSEFHGWLYIISDLMIWLAYFLIPIIIINYFTRKKEKIRYQKVYLLFAAFILLCGTTHFVDAVMFWLPMYRLNGLIRLLTGITSLLTVYYLVKALPQLFTQKTNVELENEIILRKEAEGKLEKMNSGLKTFAAIASHDLKEPLRKISIFTSMLLDRNLENFDDRSTEYVAKISNASHRMQILIQDILTLSSSNEDVDMEPVKLNDAILPALENLEWVIRDKTAIIEIDDLPTISGNKNLLTQLFYNLLNNGMKFCKRTPFIHISSEKKNDYFWIHVSDNGIGISEENYLKIFDSLHRLHPQSEYEGHGLGLAICKKIVDTHHGLLTVSSKENEGTTFSIRFNLP